MDPGGFERTLDVLERWRSSWTSADWPNAAAGSLGLRGSCGVPFARSGPPRAGATRAQPPLPPPMSASGREGYITAPKNQRAPPMHMASRPPPPQGTNCHAMVAGRSTPLGLAESRHYADSSMATSSYDYGSEHPLEIPQDQIRLHHHVAPREGHRQDPQDGYSPLNYLHRYFVGVHPGVDSSTKVICCG